LITRVIVHVLKKSCRLLQMDAADVFKIIRKLILEISTRAVKF
jgi:hypothetical protein